jgi:hypothetical protein
MNFIFELINFLIYAFALCVGLVAGAIMTWLIIVVLALLYEVFHSFKKRIFTK